MRMDTAGMIHTLTEEEINALKSLIGKSIWKIQSERIELSSSTPDLYPFIGGIDIVVEHDLDDIAIHHFSYAYSETLDGEDFIELRTSKQTRSKRQVAFKCASLSLDEKGGFVVNKIEVYGDTYMDKSGMVSTENVILLYNKQGKRICMECMYPYLQVNVTMNEDLIELTLLGLMYVYSPAYIVGSTLKHTIE